MAPDFELASLDGRRMRLSDCLGSGPLLLAFYKNSCATSQLTYPFIQAIFRSLPGGVEPRIWGISQDDRSQTSAFVSHYDLGFPVLVDERPYRVSTAYQLRFVPTLYLIGQDQKIQLAHSGFSKSILNEVARALAENANVPVPGLFSDRDGLPERRPG